MSKEQICAEDLLQRVAGKQLDPIDGIEILSQLAEATFTGEHDSGTLACRHPRCTRISTVRRSRDGAPGSVDIVAHDGPCFIRGVGKTAAASRENWGAGEGIRRYKETTNYLGYGPRIRASRLRAGLSQEQVASLIGISRSIISKFENERVKPHRHSLYALGLVLNTNPDYLAWGEGSPERSDSVQFINDREARLLKIFREATDEEISLFATVLKRERGKT